MRIALIGAGISGLTAAWLLSRRHEVTVFEAEPRIGGHTATVDVTVAGQHFAIDTGFIVFNDRTYPNFIRLLGELGVASQATEMSFSVSNDLSGLEYAGSNLNTLFAQRRNLLRPRFWAMVRDILRFNRSAVSDLEQGRIPDGMTLGEYLDEGGYCAQFRDDYLVPMGAAIWSSGTRQMDAFPVEFFIRFFRNHGLLSIADRPQWRTIVGGSRSYLDPLKQRFASAIHTNDPVIRIVREAEQVELGTRSGRIERFDQVILACHSDQALALLDRPSTAERSILEAIPYRDNAVVLHTDTRVLPRSRRAWSSWNYRVRAGAGELPVLSYDMNILQKLDADTTFCVTLNDTSAIDPARILGRYNYSHPVFSVNGIRAQARWAEINGTRRTWFCGAWWGNGFHEDGVTSALRVAHALGVEW
ncbi:MAG: FAD-dependent oxidoreductase [Gammaproteobacteria bacterium]|jgi:predicted NAD/FAD-binding protein|nr:FAD-dependent oxidoreductase [Gammaproteobacteria bacterium]MBP6050678.1 FAD-dependent oxidoreductase [Pseudomonadales bacterium]MBK6585493.1 FAD-dependent oxidoreductase [Gammaproteobacteria bacterium]MBK7168858.1 FAD-dependent oxidoreductase [Gammaproteobacteria bacterium]MBK7521012.1 FAD-dependent oxidoreductase [Gammaproteobacteria bacterium]